VDGGPAFLTAAGQTAPDEAKLGPNSFRRRCAMSKMLGRFKHINRGIVIEDGREIEFCIQLKSGDECTVQLPVGEIPRVIRFLEALQMQASDD
jgi:hypothetical protein